MAATSTIYEPVMNALLAYLKANIAANTFLYYQRGILIWERIPEIMNANPLIRQPCLFLYDGFGFGGGVTKFVQRGRALPPVRTMERTIVIYNKLPVAGGFPGGQIGGSATSYTTTSGAAILHPLLEAVEAALDTPDNASTNTLTLGGLVQHCWIEGDTHLLTPDIDENGQGMATLPVRILIP
jgi:hypothetical protein